MGTVEIPLEELNVFSELHYVLMQMWENLLVPREKPELTRDLAERLAKALREQASSICKKTRRVHNDVESAYRQAGYEVISFEARLEERGLFGGAQHFGALAFEVGLEFDPFINSPIIPGSSVKGAIRSAWQTLFGEGEVEDYMFGSPNSIGSCLFFDGYPVKAGRNGYLLYPDILTPHYSRGGKDILREHEVEPSPVVYLTVAPETVFKFIIAVPRSLEEDLRKKLREACFESLKIGIGGKTSIGYGRFRIENIQLSYGGT